MILPLVLAVALRALLAHDTVVIDGDRICATSAIRTFYERRAYEPAWTDADIAALIAAVHRTSEDGLEPASYHLVAIGRTRDPVELDVLASDAFLLLGSDLTQGRVDPKSLVPNWCIVPRKIDVAAVLQSALDAHDVAGVLARLAPRHPEYLRLKDALATLRATEPESPHIQQLLVNLERWRWMPDDLGETYVIVNIAAFELHVYEERHETLSMKTVVGKSYTRTPFFAADIKEVVLNPPWNVPDSIAGKELWPKQRRDGSFFRREHMVVTNDGRLRQTPGPWNSLGRIKFNVPNPYNVYLHDTPAKSLFDRDQRAFSHGCIRLERPLDLAVYLLRDQPQWDAIAIQATIDSGETLTVPLTKPMRVYVLYWTAWVGDDGAVTFQKDVYKRDAEVARAMGGRR